MSIENYAVYRATPGSRCDIAAKKLIADREAARDARLVFSRSINALGTYGNEVGVVGVIFARDTELKTGWRKDCMIADGIVAVPNKRTPEGKVFAKQLRELPQIPGSMAFTHAIGGSWVVVGRAGRLCYFERIGDELFVFTPYTTGEGNEEPVRETRKSFHPDGCEPVKLSEFFAIKESQPAEAVA